MRARFRSALRLSTTARMRARVAFLAATVAVALVASCREQTTQPIVQHVAGHAHLLAPCTPGELDWYYTYPDQNCPQFDTVVDHQVIPCVTLRL